MTATRKPGPSIFPVRPRREQGEAANYWIWTSRCGRFRVVRSVCRYGPRRGPKAIPQLWRVERLELIADREGRGQRFWRILSLHYQRAAAFRAAEKVVRAEDQH